MIKNIIGREVENANRYAEKNVVKAEFKKLWKRDCKAESKVFATFAGESVIIKELYAIYDALKNRPNMERKYTKKLLADVIGTQRDPVQTEMELARREEVARIETEYRAKIHDANPDNWNSEAHKRLQKIYEEMKATERRKMKALEEEMHQKIAEVNESLKAAMMMGIVAA